MRLGGRSARWHSRVCQGIPEFCVSIGFVENGRPVAGGICNPATNEIFLGSVESGVTYNGKPSQTSQRRSLEGALVLASRSEVNRGEWKPFEDAAFEIRAMGSVAYKLALVVGWTRRCHFYSHAQE